MEVDVLMFFQYAIFRTLCFVDIQLLCASTKFHLLVFKMKSEVPAVYLFALFHIRGKLQRRSHKIQCHFF
jgi:hypothetical protein